MPNSAATNLQNSPTEAGVTSGDILGEFNGHSRQPSDAPFCAEDYVQLACTLRKSVRLSVRGTAISEAEIAIFRGELWRVSDEHGGGSAAFRRLLGRPCTVQVEVLSEADRGPRNVFHNWEQLLLLAAMEDTSGEAANARSSLDADTRESRPSGVRHTLAVTPNRQDASSHATSDRAVGRNARTSPFERRPLTGRGQRGSSAPAQAVAAGTTSPDDPASVELANSAVVTTAEKAKTTVEAQPDVTGQRAHNNPKGRTNLPVMWRGTVLQLRNAASSLSASNIFSVPPMFTRRTPLSGGPGKSSSRHIREIQRGLKETIVDVGTALQELKSRPDRRRTFLAAGIMACVAVLWLNFVQGEFRRLSNASSSMTSSSLR